ncbi:MAG: MFS transporter [Lachnospiraceae bacterium]|nr:MFS transporter [Lachnospiraceae bacterium]
MKKEKLNVRHTVFVGAAFLAITAFWQMYNNVNPLILTNTFHLNELFTGIIMAADNVFALFLLPLFGSLSDRTKSPMGKRKPFILVGTLISVALLIQLPILDNMYYDSPAVSKLVMYIVVLALLLISMSSFRSPAVALMPDVTPKPFRSRGNAIINLMGSVGGIIYLIITSILYSEAKTAGKEHVSYLLLFAIIGGIMIAALIVIMLLVNEPKWTKQAEEYELRHPEEINALDADAEKEKTDDAGNATADSSKLPAPVFRSLMFLLISISLWFISYNSIETWFTTYAAAKWSMSLGEATKCLTIATAAAILMFIPLGYFASFIGRKKSILIGIALLFVNFGVCFFYTFFSNTFHPILFVVFSLVGIGWAMINVNSLPMVVEMCKNSDIGKFTGYYYTFSMAAQIVTPILAGWLLNKVGYFTLFLYAMVFAALSFVTMMFVRHGDHKAVAKSSIDAFEEMDS